MKYLSALIVLCILTFSACKKDRVCKCTVITTGTTSTHVSSSGIPTGTAATSGIDTTISVPLSTKNDNEITFYKVSKKRAKHNCFDKSETLNETNENGVPGFLSISVTNTGKRDYNCELK